MIGRKPRLSARESALFAVLLRDEHDRRVFDGGLSYIKRSRKFETIEQFNYRRFLRANRRHGDKLCPYGAAVRMIEGRG